MLKMREVGVKRGYSLWSEEYDRQEKWNPLMLLEKRPLLKMIGNVKNKKILDVGCGTGRITVRLLRRGAIVCGIDITKAMLEKAKKKVLKFKNRCELKLGSAYQIPYPDAEFDVVVCSLVISHLKNLDKVVGEMARVLKPNGEIVISDMHPYGILFLRWSTTFPTFGKFYKIKNYVHLFEDYLKCCEKNKLKLVEVKEPKVTKRVVKAIEEGNRKFWHRKLSRKERKELKEFIGKPGLLIMRMKKLYTL
jgi:malonyl-CoA O-methyltransferase